MLTWTFFGALLGFLGVTLGAFGAHALRDRLTPQDLTIFETAVRYQFFHALALIGVDALGWMARGHGLGAATATWIRGAGLGFTLGTLVFSGSLYLLVGTGVRRWGMVTPLGGLGMLLGWACFAIAAWKVRG